MTAFQNVRRSIWSITKPSTYGVHAIPLTSEGRIVLVKLTYANGWRMPGGGRKPREDPSEAMVRELREEIGLSACGALQLLQAFEHQPDHRNGRSHLFLATDVVYRPRRWSLEVEEVKEFSPDDLPPDMGLLTARMIERFKHRLRP